MKTRTVISKSAKRKMTSEVNFPIEVDGKTQMKKVVRQKANDYTEQVVYREKLPNGKFTSVTKHERRQKV
jgi:hypothetical protein